MMKFVLPQLKVGQRVWARVQEVLSSGEVIVNFHGDLLRMGNHTGRVFGPGERIELEIRATHPLKFQLVEAPRTGLNLSV